MMRKTLFTILAAAALAAPAFAIDISTASGAAMRITTKTSLGIDLDRPGERYGLKVEFPEFGVFYNMAPNQEVTNRVKSDKPAGFIDLSMDVQELRFTNGAKNSYNSPGTNVGLDFNDSADQPTGYFGPFYVYGFQSGIAYKDYVLQLAAGGNDSFWKPWNRTLEFLNDRLGASWAYMDTRVQFRRDVVSALPIDMMSTKLDEGNYWSFQGSGKNPPNPYTSPAGADLDSLFSTIPRGTMIGLQHTTEAFSYMAKAATEYAYDSSSITGSNANGLAAGFDYSVTPTALKGFRVLGSFTGQYNYGNDSDADPLFGGLKLSYELPVQGQKGVSLEPYLGYDGCAFLDSGGSVDFGQEIAGGATLHWPGKSGWLYDNFQNRQGVVNPGLTASYKLYIPADGSAFKHNVLVTLMEDSGDGGALYGLGAEAVLQFFDITSASNGKLLASLYADYTVKKVLGGKLIPYAKVFYDFYLSDSSSALKLDLGARLTEAVQNCVLGLAWDSGALIGPPLAGGAKLGQLKTYAEISL